MDVLIVGKFVHYVGGVETYLRWQVNELQRRGHRVGVVGMRPPDDETMMDLGHARLWLTARRDYHGTTSEKLVGAAASVWSRQAARVMQDALEEFRPEIVHVHGTCYQLTPAVIQAAHTYGRPLFATAHEYKLACANQTLYDDRAASICTDCVGASPMQRFQAPIRRRCLKGSLPVSTLAAVEQQIADRVWRAADPVVLAPSRFMRATLIDDRVPTDRVHYLDLPWGPAPARVQVATGPRDSLLTMSRLAPLKGVHMVLRAWEKVAPRHPDVRLRVLGRGEAEDALRALAAQLALPRVDFLGHGDAATVQAEVDRALVTAHPGQSHENSPFAVRESLMSGVPVCVSDVGGMPDMVGPHSGRVVPRSDVSAWARALSEMLDARSVGSTLLKDEVERRAMTDEAHLDELEHHYELECERVASTV